MGLNFFISSDDRDNVSSQSKKKIVRLNSTPDPSRFIIRSQKIVNGYPILVVQYFDVTNYEGIKVLVYNKHFDLNKIKNRIDPHFFDKGDSPIARFIPTNGGIEMAKILAENLP